MNILMENTDETLTGGRSNIGTLVSEISKISLYGCPNDTGNRSPANVSVSQRPIIHDIGSRIGGNGIFNAKNVP